jgi:hypothetical protein
VKSLFSITRREVVESSGAIIVSTAGVAASIDPGSFA